MTCRLFGTKPLSEPMPTYRQLDHQKHILMKFHLEFESFRSEKCRPQTGGHFVCYLESEVGGCLTEVKVM